MLSRTIGNGDSVKRDNLQSVIKSLRSEGGHVNRDRWDINIVNLSEDQVLSLSPHGSWQRLIVQQMFKS